MKSVFVTVLVVSALIAVCVAQHDECECIPAAGCRAIGCECQMNGVTYEPITYPAQPARPTKCAPCPARPCPSDLVRMACDEVQQCEEEQLKTYVKKA